MEEKTSLESSNNISINSPANLNINNIDTESQINPVPIVEEKSTFERAIIESFKQSNSSECIKKLSIAYDEINFLITEVKSSRGRKFILNKNLVDKLNRLSERKYFNLNILIAKIYESLLDTSNFVLLSNNLNLLISFSNHVLNILDIIKSTNVSRDLEKKCSCFLNYLLTNKDFVLDDEQKETITELLNSFPTRNSSEAYKKFAEEKENIISLCRSKSNDEKIKGIGMLMELFSDTYSLEEQFDLLMEHGQHIIKSIIHQPNPENQSAYFKLGNFIISMLYSFKFRVRADYFNVNIERKVSNSRAFFIYDKENNNKMIENVKENNFEDLLFLDGALFELTNQKDLLLKCENIFSICILILNTLTIYDSLFDIQYVCYLVLKKIYFTFPKFRKQIEDLIAVTLINICSFKLKEQRDNSVECRQFLHYILKYGEEELKNKINHRIQSKGENVDITINDKIPIDQIDVEYDILNFGFFNLRIGYPNLYNVEAGNVYEKYVEIEYPNSLIYVGFASDFYDINFHLYKYIPNDDSKENKDNFIEIFKLDRIECSEIPIKVIVFIKTPGIYKISFDNSYSWFTTKVIKHRLSVLRATTEIDVNKSPFPVNNKNNIKEDSTNLEINTDISNKNKEDSNNKIVPNDGKNNEEKNEENADKGDSSINQEIKEENKKETLEVKGNL